MVVCCGCSKKKEPEGGLGGMLGFMFGREAGRGGQGEEDSEWVLLEPDRGPRSGCGPTLPVAARL